MTDVNWPMMGLVPGAVVLTAVLIVVVKNYDKRKKAWHSRAEHIRAAVDAVRDTTTNPLHNPAPDVTDARKLLAQLFQSPDQQDRRAAAYASRLCTQEGVDTQKVIGLSEDDHRVELAAEAALAALAIIEQMPPLEAMTANLAVWYTQWMHAADKIISLLRYENNAVQVRVLLQSGFNNVSELETRWVEYRDKLITVRLDLGILARTTEDLLAQVDSIVSLVAGLSRLAGTPKARLSAGQLEDYYQLLCKLPPERLTERHLLEHSSFVRYCTLWLLKERFSAVPGTHSLGKPADAEPDPQLLITAWWLNRPQPADAHWTERDQATLEVVLCAMLSQQRQAWLARVTQADQP